MSTDHKIETERLYLTPTSEEDAVFILELMNMPKWLKYIGERNVKTVASAKAYIATKMIPQFKRLGYSNYTISRKSDGIKIGTCGLFDREGLEGIDIGFAFLPSYEKKGYAFESSKKLINIAFEEFDITEINAITTKENISSQKLLEKLGLNFMEFTRIPNDEEELMLYRIIK